ncbi:hypothetical protein [Dapis sp. BLCC M229]
MKMKQAIAHNKTNKWWWCIVMVERVWKVWEVWGVWEEIKKKYISSPL